jgi:hypothetical protein
VNVQVVPFQFSISGTVPPPEGALPTAVQSEDFTHETPSKWLPAPGCFTTWNIQPDELLVSDSSWPPAAVSASPTAMQTFGELQETAVNCPVSIIGKAAVVCWSQLASAAVAGQRQADPRPAGWRRQRIGRAGGERA